MKKKMLFALIALALIFSATPVFAMDPAGPPGVVTASTAQEGSAMITVKVAKDPLDIIEFIFLGVIATTLVCMLMSSESLLNKQVIRGKARQAKADVTASPKRKKAGSRKKRSGPKKPDGAAPESAQADASI